MNLFRKIKTLYKLSMPFLVGWIPFKFGMIIRYIVYKPLFKQCGKNIFIETGVTIIGFEGIELGENISIGKNSYLYSNSKSILNIGDNFSTNTNVHINASGGVILIKNDVLIGPNVVLRATNHNFEKRDIPIKKQGNISGEIHIGEDVWIASNCVITTNIKIGKGSIIAAGAVVTKNIGEYSIVGGVPAKVLKNR